VTGSLSRADPAAASPLAETLPPAAFSLPGMRSARRAS
jgi:hypothetical protein